MKITITELEILQGGNFRVALAFSEKRRFEVEIKNPHTNKTDELLEWYFEEYISEPYTADTKIKRIKKRIVDYGEQLFLQVFQEEESLLLYRNAVRTENFSNITFEIINQRNSLTFPAVLWESLRDPAFSDGPLASKGVKFIRKSLVDIKLPSAAKEADVVNLLIVTARPSEDQDVNPRTIQRPLVELIIDNDRAVKPFILRPGTFKALKTHLKEVGEGFYHIIHFDLHGIVSDYENLMKEKEIGNYHFTYTFGKPTFQARFAREDIEPYEGKRAFLLFETEEKGFAEPTSAEELSSLIRDYRIPICILNACQSAKQSGTSEETSLAKYIHEQGVSLVLAMRYSIAVTAAKHLMNELYKRLFEQRPLENAIALGRQLLYDEKNREAALGLKVDLEDWVLPVIYQHESVELKLRAPTKEEERKRLEEKSRRPKLPNLKHGFLGRDLDILKIEKLLLKSNHLLLRGMIGVGKSTLLQYLAAWWVNTKFRNIERAIYIDWREKKWTRAKLVDYLLGFLLSDDLHYKQTRKLPIQLRQTKLLEHLKRNPNALIVDHIFKLSSPEIIDFFSSITGSSFVVYGSVNGESKLSVTTFHENVYQLDGLDKDAAYQLAREIIEKDAEKDIGDLNEQNTFDFNHLLQQLAGFPAAMQTILPKLKTQSIEEVLHDFQNGI